MAFDSLSICRSGKQSFYFDDGVLPVDLLTARYVLNLIPRSPIHSELLEMVLDATGLAAVVKMLCSVFTDKVSQKEFKKIEEAGDRSDFARLIVTILDRAGNAELGEMLRLGLQAELEKVLENVTEPSVYRARADELKKILCLTDQAFKVLEIFAVYQSEGRFKSYLRAYRSTEWPSLFSLALGMAVDEFRQLAMRDGLLVKKGLVDYDGPVSDPSTVLFDCLSGMAGDFFVNDDFAVDRNPCFDLRTFTVDDAERRVLMEMLRHPGCCNIFFYGRQGTGKTELARALAAEAGRQTFSVKYRSVGSERDRRDAISATVGVAPKDAVVIIDEADRLLNTADFFQKAPVDKGWINNFMDSSEHKIIWISNRTSGIEPSVLRRFSYSLQFKRFTVQQRINAWAVQSVHYPFGSLIDDEMAGRLARKYRVDAGEISSSLQAAAGIYSETAPSPDQLENTLGTLLHHHVRLSGIKGKKERLQELTPHYDVDAVHTDIPLRKLVDALMLRENIADLRLRQSPVNILFWGLPGTGKSEFAKYISSQINKDLLVKRMSDLHSMWLGETEKNIAAAFEEAEREGALLFLDEADSLILDRNNAMRSWESSQTNEVLTQMENFKGICICCTNLLDRLDEAALRRFTWKIKFLPLTPDGAEKLFRKYFQPKGRLSGDVKSALQEIRNLTPGDFKAVIQRHIGDPLSPVEAVSALKTEVSYKRSGARGHLGF